MNRNIMEIGYILSHVEWKLVYVRACMLSHFSHVGLFATLWTIAHQAPLSMGFSRQDTGMVCHALLQGIFLTRDHTDVSYVYMQWQAGSYH